MRKAILNTLFIIGFSAISLASQAGDGFTSADAKRQLSYQVAASQCGRLQGKVKQDCVNDARIVKKRARAIAKYLIDGSSATYKKPVKRMPRPIVPSAARNLSI